MREKTVSSAMPYRLKKSIGLGAVVVLGAALFQWRAELRALLPYGVFALVIVRLALSRRLFSVDASAAPDLYVGLLCLLAGFLWVIVALVVHDSGVVLYVPCLALLACGLIGIVKARVHPRRHRHDTASAASAATDAALLKSKLVRFRTD